MVGERRGGGQDRAFLATNLSSSLVGGGEMLNIMNEQRRGVVRGALTWRCFMGRRRPLRFRFRYSTSAQAAI